MTKPPLRILAADIGGTHSRYRILTVDEDLNVVTEAAHSLPTRQENVRDFASYWRRLMDTAPEEFTQLDTFDAVSLALAGSVQGHRAVLPNIDWDLDLGALDASDDTGLLRLLTDGRLFLLNDFIAQGCALLSQPLRERLHTVREGAAADDAAIAVVGAGTGLGHCVLRRPYPGAGYQVCGSEAGHATFSFCGKDEKALEQAWLKRSNKAWLSNDDVVSGAGIVMLHACLSRDTVTPAEALASQHTQTRDWFSRFYARACRNYCLNVFPVRSLVISGGVAGHNPDLIASAEFMRSFEDAPHYRELLAAIPIMLNPDPAAGIKGAAIHAALQLRPLAAGNLP